MAGVRDKYVKLDGLDDILIVRKDNGEQMFIHKDDVRKRIVKRSEEAFYDKFSNESHYLVYYDWKADLPPQQSLI